MDTNDTIRLWGALILSGVWAAASEILTALTSPQKAGYAVIMSIVWMVIAFLPIIAYAIRAIRGR